MSSNTKLITQKERKKNSIKNNTQQNSKESDKIKDKDTTQRIPTPENVKNEIAKINKHSKKS